MLKIVITGGAGFIGTHLCKRLLEDGNEVICIDNFLTSSEKNIEQLKTHSLFTFIFHDLTKPLANDELQKLEGVHAIFHLASPASPNKKSPRSYLSYPIETLLVNSYGTYNLLELARKNNARFLFTSTSEAYGDPDVSPQNEEYNGNVNPNGIRSVYDEAKRFGEAMTFGYLRKFDLNARIIRIFNTFGPLMQKDDGRVVSNFINQALAHENITLYGDGKQTRSFCYVDDMVEGIVRAMFMDRTKGQVINLGNPDERTVEQLAIMVKDLTHADSEIIRSDPMPEDDPKRRQPDISRAKLLLNWSPTITLEDGLTRTIDYFKSV